MSARPDLEAEVRRGFRAVMLSNATVDKYVSSSLATELRFLAVLFGDELTFGEQAKCEWTSQEGTLPRAEVVRELRAGLRQRP